ncbi:MAG: hypothetical protein ING49_18640 [Rubrivivax sp.]|nr:hypothetical protein [Rubrivivax sp.]
MPAQPAPVVNPSSPDEAVLAPYPRGFDIAPGARRYDGFAVGQPGPVRVMVRSAQPVVVALRRPDGRRVERTGSGDLAIDDVASDADVRQALFWGVSIQPQMPGSGAQGQIMVTAPPADPQAVRAALERGRQAGAQQAQAAIGQAPASGFDPAVALAAQQRELDQQALARHNAALRQIQAQLHPDTAAVMTQAQQARVQGQTLAQAQGAMVNDTRIARLAASGASMAGAPAGNALVAPARGRLLTAPGAAPAQDVPGGMATAQGGGAPAQAGGAPSAAAVTNALNRMFQSQPNSAPPAAGATPTVQDAAKAVERLRGLFGRWADAERHRGDIERAPSDVDHRVPFRRASPADRPFRATGCRGRCRHAGRGGLGAGDRRRRRRVEPRRGVDGARPGHACRGRATAQRGRSAARAAARCRLPRRVPRQRELPHAARPGPSGDQQRGHRAVLGEQPRACTDPAAEHHRLLDRAARRAPQARRGADPAAGRRA